MRPIELGTKGHRGGAAALGIGALCFTVGCGAREGGSVAAQSLAANGAGVPVVVSCEPHQRTLVRPVVVDGATVSQIECVATGQTPGAPDAAVAPALAAPLTAAPQPVYRTTRAPQPVYDDLGDVRVVPAAYPEPARPTQTRQVVYDREPVQEKRSVKKSAVIIGSSAGVGAGVGAIVGGKKGALIGAAIGGGGATIWDQVTRRK